jgi:plasmid stabilization system protein ParE
MPRSVRFHPAALQDAEEAAGWYAERSARAAVRFLDELDRLIDLIVISPSRFQVSMPTSGERFFVDFRSTSSSGQTT